MQSVPSKLLCCQHLPWIKQLFKCHEEKRYGFTKWRNKRRALVGLASLQEPMSDASTHFHFSITKVFISDAEHALLLQSFLRIFRERLTPFVPLLPSFPQSRPHVFLHLLCFPLLVLPVLVSIARLRWRPANR